MSRLTSVLSCLPHEALRGPPVHPTSARSSELGAPRGDRGTYCAIDPAQLSDLPNSKAKLLLWSHP